MKLKKEDTLKLLENCTSEELINDATKIIKLCVTDIVIALNSDFGFEDAKVIADSVSSEAFERTIYLMGQSIENKR